MIIPAGDYDDYGAELYTPNIHGVTGSAHSVSQDREAYDRVQDLREVVAEVTNGRIPAPVRKPMGFY